MTRRARNFERERNRILYSFRGGILTALIHRWVQLTGRVPPLNYFYFYFYFLLGIDIHRPRQQGKRIVNIQSFADIKGLACRHANQ